MGLVFGLPIFFHSQSLLLYGQDPQKKYWAFTRPSPCSVRRVHTQKNPRKSSTRRSAFSCRNPKQADIARAMDSQFLYVACTSRSSRTCRLFRDPSPLRRDPHMICTTTTSDYRKVLLFFLALSRGVPGYRAVNCGRPAILMKRWPRVSRVENTTSSKLSDYICTLLFCLFFAVVSFYVYHRAPLVLFFSRFEYQRWNCCSSTSQYLVPGVCFV